jgi:glycosyltransferase involved in cell wall biosynthesis
MKILTGIDIPFNPFGGSPIIVNDWYSNLPQGIDVLFLTMPPTKQAWWSMKNVHFLTTPKTRDVKLYPTYIKNLSTEVNAIINEYNPDIIHMQHLNYGLSRAFSLQQNIPKIGICHGTDVQIAKSSAFFMDNMVQIVDSASHIVFPAQNMANDFLTTYKTKIPYTVISHGIPAEAFHKSSPHVLGKTIKLLYAGRLNYYKGADIAVEALTHTKASVSLDIIGGEDETGYIEKLTKIITVNNLGNRIKIEPQVSRSELWKIFSNYGAIIIPSRELEAFSLTAVEAQAHGIPVIYGNGGGIVDVVGKSGIQIHDNNPKTLARIVDDIMQNPEILIKYRELGFANATKYRLDKQITKLMNISKNYAKRTE